MKIPAYIWMILSIVMLDNYGLKSQVIAEAGKDSILCEQDSLILGGNPSATGGAGGYKYAWFCNDFSFINIFASDILAPSHPIFLFITMAQYYNLIISNYKKNYYFFICFSALPAKYSPPCRGGSGR